MRLIRREKSLDTGSQQCLKSFHFTRSLHQTAKWYDQAAGSYVEKYWAFWDKNSWEWRFIWDLERDLGQTDHRPSSDSNKSTWSDDNINTVSVSCFPSLVVYSVFEHSLSCTAPPYWHQMCFLADFWQDCKASVLLCSPPVLFFWFVLFSIMFLLL